MVYYNFSCAILRYIFILQEWNQNQIFTFAYWKFQKIKLVNIKNVLNNPYIA